MINKFLKFSEARDFVREKKLKSRDEWFKWSKNNRPTDIPSRPECTYKKQWISWGDWLGNNDDHKITKKLAKLSKDLDKKELLDKYADLMLAYYYKLEPNQEGQRQCLTMMRGLGVTDADINHIRVRSKLRAYRMDELRNRLHREWVFHYRDQQTCNYETNQNIISVEKEFYENGGTIEEANMIREFSKTTDKVMKI
jgi:hypothetical protein